MAPRTQGKPSTFSEAQNKLLRAALLRVLEDVPKRERTGARVGAWLGVGQQTASRYLSGKAGFGYEAAFLIARAAGHKGLDEFFEAHHALLAPPDTSDANAWRGRDLASSLARRAGIGETVIRRVTMRYAEDRFKNHPPKWWDERFRIEHEDELARATATQNEAATDAAAEKLRAKRPRAEEPEMHRPARTRRAKAG